jgi:tetratricopeptide (TPR) repeat protein
VTAVTAGALLGMLSMSVLAGFALNARADADRQRAEAEGLVEFMLTDLRTTLKGVGRLDAMAAVNRRALQYYGNNDIAALPPESLQRRVRILHAMGEDDEARGDWSAAKGKFAEAHRTTKALLDKAPDDPNRVFDHAQSEFWIGEVAYEKKDYQDAKRGFVAYKELADRLLILDPTNSRSLREAGYADGNLCTLAIESTKKPREAIPLCQSALKYMEAAAERLHRTPDILADVANRHAWLADAYCVAGQREQCAAHRRTQEAILADLMRADTRNMWLKQKWISVQRVLGWLEFEAGNKRVALARLRRALKLSDQLVAFDHSNESWSLQRAVLTSDITQIKKMQTKRVAEK